MAPDTTPISAIVTPDVPDGMYRAINRASKSYLDLADGSSVSQTRVQGFQLTTKGDFGNQIWIIQKDGKKGAYTLRNLQGGTYLTLIDGNNKNQAPTGGCPRVLTDPDRFDQEWIIERKKDELYQFKCSRTSTVLEIPNGNKANGAQVTCSTSNEKNEQLWSLEPISCDISTIIQMLKDWKSDIGPFFRPDGDSAKYFLLPNELRTNLWNDTRLGDLQPRDYLLDHSSFVVKMKEFAIGWANTQFTADIQNYGVNLGIIWGEVDGKLSVYNWYLSANLSSLRFFNAQSGDEFGTAELDKLRFKPTGVLF